MVRLDLAICVRKYLALALGVVVAMSLAVMSPTMAEDDKAAARQQQLPVNAEQALYLIRSTLLTLNDANRSGNYSVLRDLAAPDFQARNSAADLALGFTDLRRRNFDLFSVALAAPQLSTPPYLDPNKMLRLTGFFPTRPLQINFDLTFQNVANQWRPYGISVATPQATPEAAAAPAPAPAKKNAAQKN
ncbi:hypothetical protein XI08_02925 [Bradyrhizobium sp. CCBAU 11361]|nr:hypothetical protein [Bradyrhizobium sp. CCBAU 11361]